MTDKNFDEYKKKLEGERRMLLAEIKQAERPPRFGDAEDPDWDEKTDEAEELSKQLAIAGDLKKRLDEIDIALSKIYSGKYGVCEKCGGAIEREVLEVDPASRLCKDCKSRS